jgi:hypothetical protein
MLQRATTILLLSLIGSLFGPPPRERRRSLPPTKELRTHRLEHLSAPRRSAWTSEPAAVVHASAETAVESFEYIPESPTHRAPARARHTEHPAAAAASAAPHTRAIRPPLTEMPQASSAARVVPLDENPSMKKPTHRLLAPGFRVPAGTLHRFTGFDPRHRCRKQRQFGNRSTLPRKKSSPTSSQRSTRRTSRTNQCRRQRRL